MKWTVQQLQDYENRRKAQSSKPQRVVRDEPLAAPEGKGSNSSRVHVCVISKRRRLIDPDNLCPKYFIDCLRYAGIIRDDNAHEISLEVRQEKASEDVTILEITKATLEL